MPEPRAITVAAFIASLTLAALLSWLAQRSRHAQALRVWMWAILFSATGALLNVTQGHLPLVISLLLGNALMVGGAARLVDGARVLNGLPTRQAMWVVPVAIMSVATLFWGVWDTVLAPRVAVFSGLLMAMMLALLVALRPMWRPSMRVGYVFVAIPTVLMAVLMLVRAVRAAMGEVQSVTQTGGTFNMVLYLMGSMTFVAIQVGLILVHQLLVIEALQADARRDPLTGLLNRHALVAMLPASLAGTALIAMDIDRFKQVNDVHGHDAGDRVLALAGALLSRQLREGDLAVRMGGEEFAVLLPHAGVEVARSVAERLRLDIERSTPADLGFPVTASFGVVAVSGAVPFAELWSRADHALYQAKHQGRNRVVVSVDEVDA